MCLIIVSCSLFDNFFIVLCSANLRVRVISSNGIIRTIAGTGSSSYSGEDIAGTSSAIGNLSGLDVDSNNSDLYISAYTLRRVFVLTGSNGFVSTFAGSGGSSSSGDGGPATSAGFLSPGDIFLESTSKLFIADENGYKIRTVYSVMPTVSPSVTPSLAPTILPTVFPTAKPTSTSPTVLPTTAPSMMPSILPTIVPSLKPTNVPSSHPTVNPTTSFPTVIPSVLPSIGPSFSPTCLPSASRSTQNSVSTLIGTGSGSVSSGSNGPVTAASIGKPFGVWEDSSGNIYVSEYSSNCVRRIQGGMILDFAGVCNVGGATFDGLRATSANLQFNVGVASSTGGVVYIAANADNRVLSVSSNGIISYAVGTGASSDSGNEGPATSASLRGPNGLFVDASGVLFITSIYGQNVRKVVGTVIKLVAGLFSLTCAYHG